MSYFIEIITLALVQGLTEFLPVSSSAHLILVPILTGWKDQGLAFDIAVHLGTLLAVCCYFRQDIHQLVRGFCRSVTPNPMPFYSTFSWQLIIATIPIAVIGLLAHDYIATQLRSPLVIAVSTISFGLMLLASDYFSKHARELNQLRWQDVIIIGFAQVLALIPGTSRSGITLTAGLALGYNRESSAKFSFLLSIPVIGLAGAYEGTKLLLSTQSVQWSFLLLGIFISAISAYFCIDLFLQFIRKIGVLPFVIYRLALGSFLLLMFL